MSCFDLRLTTCPECKRPIRVRACGRFVPHNVASREKGSRRKPPPCVNSGAPSGRKDVRRPGVDNPGAWNQGLRVKRKDGP
jgi:hypothetical protein